jgi:hypothetical protein
MLECVEKPKGNKPWVWKKTGRELDELILLSVEKVRQAMATPG